ncbi:MAG: deoxyribonuclease V [Sphingobacteriales bacterium]|nr:MAG: deoxyribonuclease V [Sphingobacteriales bacterium]
MITTNYNELSPAGAVALQQELRDKIQLTPLQKPVTTIAGADISFNKYSETVYAGIIVLSYPGLVPITESTVVSSTKFPYIPGLLGFREVPALLEAWNKLETKPDVLVLDGQGIAHPRRMGIATHFGLVANTPTIGCAKSLLTGKYDEPADLPGATSPLTDKGEVIGAVLRTKRKCNPVYVSPGHLITMQQSIDIIMNCITTYRIPEPTRVAHLFVNRVRTQGLDNSLF